MEDRFRLALNALRDQLVWGKRHHLDAGYPNRVRVVQAWLVRYRDGERYLMLCSPDVELADVIRMARMERSGPFRVNQIDAGGFNLKTGRCHWSAMDGRSSDQNGYVCVWDDRW